MELEVIRPHSTYVGNDGSVKEVRAVKMAIDGRLFVEWQILGTVAPEAWSKRKNHEPIEQFAAWAQYLTRSMSDDIQHCVTPAATFSVMRKSQNSKS